MAAVLVWVLVVLWRTWTRTPSADREREFFVDNLLVRIHFVIEMILVDRLRAMGVLNSLFQVALHLPSCRHLLVFPVRRGIVHRLPVWDDFNERVLSPQHTACLHTSRYERVPSRAPSRAPSRPTH